jgi:hypothetical protein
LLKSLLIGLEEQISNGILTQRWQVQASLTGEILHEKLVGDTGHHTGTITVSRVRANGSTVGHVAQQIAG